MNRINKISAMASWIIATFTILYFGAIFLKIGYKPQVIVSLIVSLICFMQIVRLENERLESEEMQMNAEIINEFITHLVVKIGTYKSDDVIKVSDVFKMCEDIKDEILNKKENNDGNT